MFIFHVQKEAPSANAAQLQSLVHLGLSQDKAGQLLDLLKQFNFTSEKINSIVKFFDRKGLPSDLTNKLESLEKVPGITNEVRQEAALMLLNKSVGVELAINLALLRASSDKTVQVYNFETKQTNDMSIDTLTKMVSNELTQKFANKSALYVLRSGLGFSNDEALFAYVGKRMEGITKDDLLKLGKIDFNAFVSGAANSDLIKTLSIGAITSQNIIDNPGSEITLTTVDHISNTIAPNLIGVVLAGQSLKTQQSEGGTRFNLSSEGGVRLEVGSGGNRNALCYRLSNSIYEGSCLSLNINEQYYQGGSLDEAVQKATNQTSTGNEIIAAQRFGQKFVDKINDIVNIAVVKFLDSRSGDADVITNSILNQLQTLENVNEMQSNSAFVYDISKKKREEKERQDEEISGRGGFT